MPRRDEWDKLLDEAALAFGGSVRGGLEHGNRIWVSGRRGGACSVYRSANAPGNRYEIAISPTEKIGEQQPSVIVEWIEREKAVNGRETARHYGEDSWPTLGFANYKSAAVFLSTVHQVRAKKLDPAKLPASKKGADPEDITDVASPEAGSGEENPLLAEYEAQTAGLPDSTEVYRWVRQRIGQNILRQRLLEIYGGRCVVTDLDVPSLLRTSHIKPWKESTDAERLNPANALLLAPHLDAVFDAHLASFDEAGNLILSDSLDEESRRQLGINGGRLRHAPSAEQRRFLAGHRARLK